MCLQPRARELYLLDWWFVSSSRAADAFGLVAEPALFANYTLLNQQRLNSPKSGRPVIMGHGVLLWRPHRARVFRCAQPPSRPAAQPPQTPCCLLVSVIMSCARCLHAPAAPVPVPPAYWGMHMIWGLHAPLRFVAAIATDFSLGRVWKRDVGANTCRGLKAGCANPAGCSSADVLRRPWQDEAAVGSMPVRPRPVEFTYGAEQTSRACGVGYFTCHGESKMCKEEQTTWEPMDTTPMRKVWYDCTATGFCQQFGLSPYSPRCAGAMLAVWTSVWKHSPWVANTVRGFPALP